MSTDLSRKTRLHFETEPHPATVSFDDGRMRRSLPYAHFVEVFWPHHDAATIKVEIGNYLVVLIGHNLQPLYEALVNQTLKRVEALPAFAKARGNEGDCFVTEIRFTVPPLAMKAGLTSADAGPSQMPLGLT